MPRVLHGCLAVEQIDPSRDEVAYKGVHWWPLPGAATLDPSIPVDLSEALREGMRCLGAAAPHAAAVMYRRTIEEIVRDKGSTKAIGQLENGDLPGALKVMANENDLAQRLRSGQTRSGDSAMSAHDLSGQQPRPARPKSPGERKCPARIAALQTDLPGALSCD